MLAGIPRGIEQHLVSLLAPTALEAEQYRTLRHLVEQKQKESDLRVLIIASPTFGDGRTTTAINLAGTLAQDPGARVLLVDADLRHPSVHTYLGLAHSDGQNLVDAILNPSIPLEQAVRPYPPFNLVVLPAGRPPAVPYEVLKLPRLERLIWEARQYYDYIILDAPPLIPLPDCRLIGQWADGLVMVVALHKTPRKLLEEAIQTTDPARTVSFVLNGVDSPLPGQNHISDQPFNNSQGRLLDQVVRKLGGFLRHRRY